MTKKLPDIAIGEVRKDVNICKIYGSRQELSSEYLVAKIAFDIAENEPRRVWITDLSDHIVRPKAERLVDDALDVFSIAGRGM